MSEIVPIRREPHHRVRRAFFVLALVTLSVYVLVQAQAVLLPLVFAGLFAMLFDPVVQWLAARMPRGVAIGLVTLVLFALVVGVLFAAGQQIAGFSSDLPSIQEKATSLLEDAQTWVSDRLGVSESRIERQVEQRLEAAPQKATETAQSWAGTLTGFLTDFLLFFIYFILLLASRQRLTSFVYRLAPQRAHGRVSDTLSDVRKVAGQYLWGRLLLICVLFVIYLGGFTIAGLNYAFVIAAIGAALSIIPYFGNIVAAGLVLVVAAFSDDMQSTMLIGLSTMAFAQIIESYVLEPLIVGDKVNLNPLTTVVAVVAFTSVWGIAGAILALPIFGILEQVLARLPGGGPWAYLMSNDD